MKIENGTKKLVILNLFQNLCTSALKISKKLKWQIGMVCCILNQFMEDLYAVSKMWWRLPDYSGI